MINAIVRVPPPKNEPVLSYAPNTPERTELNEVLRRFSSERVEIPLVIGGKQVRTGKTSEVRMTHRHARLLGTYHEADSTQVEKAIAAAMAAKNAWANTAFHERAAIFLRAAELLAARYRPLINAATMLGQSKTAHQSEIDAACESTDFLRFNVHFAEQLITQQPESGPQMWDLTDYRPLDGFVLAVSPFNFTSIAVNLPTAPALMGNTVEFKPASTVIDSPWVRRELRREAALPPALTHSVPANATVVRDAALRNPHHAGIH